MNAEIIIRHIIAGFLCVDHEWVVQRVNARASTMLRKPNRDIEGKTLWEAFPGLVGTSAERVLRSVPLTRTEQRFDVFAAELYNWFEGWAIRGDAGEIYVFFRDVSDRERAIQTEALRESLRRVLMDAPVAISITRGPEHRYELINNAARGLIGGRNLEGLTARNALPEVDESLFAILDNVYRTGEPVTLQDLEVTYDREGDGVLYTGLFDVTYQPMRDTAHKISGIIQTAVETTAFASARKTPGAPKTRAHS
ncbi:MAG TPA: PAS domain-containing protein [Gemmatimonadaceae bacterium]|nr:PAS domain-containing protein [Gemmatimonadaceae bacterium]